MTKQLIFDMPRGKLIVAGLTGEEECFTHDTAGSFNVNDATKWAKLNGQRIIATLDVQDTIEMMKGIDLDQQKLAELFQQNDLEDTTVLLYIEWNDGTHLLIDAHHRLYAIAHRAEINKEERIHVKAIVIPYADHKLFRVRYFFEYGDGTTTEITADQLLEEITGIYSNADGTFRDERPST